MKKLILLIILFTLPLYAHKETPISHGRFVSGSKSVGSFLTFSGSLSFDRDDQSLDYTPRWEWDFDYNGSSFTPDISTQSSTVNHIYYKAGNFCFAVKYTDNDNQEGNIFVGYIFITGVNRYYYVKDHLGSIHMTLDESGEAIAAQDYYPYGELLREYTTGGNVNNKYKLTEKERDVETNYDYFGARYYDSDIGRWLQVDPLADKFPGWSPYNYCINNPIKLIDPNGMVVENPYDEGSEKYIYVKDAIEKLKMTETGSALYNKLNDAEEIFKIYVSKDIHFDINFGTGESWDNLGQFDVNYDENNKVIGGKIWLFAADIKEHESFDQNTTAASFSTLGHEFQHVSQALDNKEGFKSELSNQQSNYSYYDQPYEKEAFNIQAKIKIEYNKNVNGKPFLTNFNTCLTDKTKVR